MPDGNKVVSREFRLTKTILVAEGAERLRRSVSLSLNTYGYHLIVTGGGEEALQRAVDFKGAIHLLLANVEMPDMTGVDLAQRFERERPEAKVLLVSSLDSGVIILDHGWQFLPTPFAADLLRTRIRDILKEPAPFTKEPLPKTGLMSGHERLTRREVEVLKLIARRKK
jgi:DNA-binding response OmpR family regulator